MNATYGLQKVPNGLPLSGIPLHRTTIALDILRAIGIRRRPSPTKMIRFRPHALS